MTVNATIVSNILLFKQAESLFVVVYSGPPLIRPPLGNGKSIDFPL